MKQTPDSQFLDPLVPPDSEAEIMANWEGSIDEPKVTVICQTYNHASYITDAINGFLAQETDFPFEIIVHDDASTDGTREIVDEYVTQYPSIINFIAQEENQYSQGRKPHRFTFPAARGEYIALCEGDDYWIDVKKIDEQVEVLGTYKNIEICGHPAYVYNAAKNKVPIYRYHGDHLITKDICSVLETQGAFSPTSSLMFKSRAVEDLPDWFMNGESLPFGDFFLQSIIGRFGFIYSPHAMSVYRRWVPGSATTTKILHTSVEERVQDFENEIFYTEKLYEFVRIPNESVHRRIELTTRSLCVWLAENACFDELNKFRNNITISGGNLDCIKGVILRLSARFKFIFVLSSPLLRLNRILRY